ncbi:hypothetical protein ACQ1Z4_14435, partial [Enterococcus faecalis]|uniref:hypothetical protein n=1 Tax=Enterococcus faecalis TaxID=1351 RepID=UPI003D6A904B
FYWFATFNADGQLQWEKLEPVSNSLVGSPDYMSPLQELDDHGFVLAAASTPLNGPRTEILHIGPNGKIIAETHFDGMFLVLVQP